MIHSNASESILNNLSEIALMLDELANGDIDNINWAIGIDEVALHMRFARNALVYALRAEQKAIKKGGEVANVGSDIDDDN
jgi:hypothetical protein